MTKNLPGVKGLLIRLPHFKNSKKSFIKSFRIFWAEIQNSPIVSLKYRLKGRVQVTKITWLDVLQVGHEPATEVRLVVVVEVVAVEELILVTQDAAYLRDIC